MIRRNDVIAFDRAVDKIAQPRAKRCRQWKGDAQKTAESKRAKKALGRKTWQEVKEVLDRKPRTVLSLAELARMDAE